MKRLTAVLIGTLMVFALAGCGGDKKAEDGAAVTDMTGQWKCSAVEIVSGGETVMTEKDIEEITGQKIGDLIALTAYADGTGEFLGEEGNEFLPPEPFKWEEAEDGGYTITPSSSEGGEDVMKAALEGETLTAEMTYESDVDGEKSEETAKYTFDYQGKPAGAIEDYDLELDADASRNMSNFMVSGQYLVTGESFYGTFSKGSEKYGSFGMAPVKDGTIDNKKMEVIEDGAKVRYLCEAGGNVYGILDHEKIVKIPEGKAKAETIYEGQCDCLQVSGEDLYFTKEGGILVKTDLDGKNEETVMDKEIYYPYVMDGKWVVYQDDADGESLHMYNMETEADTKLNEEESHSPVISGTTLYYFTPSEGDKFSFCRMDLTNLKTEKDDSFKYVNVAFIENGNIVFRQGGMPMVKEKEWNKLSTMSFGGTDMCPAYSNGEMSIHFDGEGILFAAPNSFDKGYEECQEIGLVFGNK